MGNRYTETKLDKIIKIGFGKIDNVVNKACDDLDELKKDFEVESGLLKYGISIKDILGYEALRFLGERELARKDLESAVSRAAQDMVFVDAKRRGLIGLHNGCSLSRIASYPWELCGDVSVKSEGV